MIDSLNDLTVKVPLLSFMAFLSIVAIVFSFHYRVGSSLSFKGRLYALIIDRSDFHDENIKIFWRDRKDVERFNAIFNIGAKSVSEVVGFGRWVDKYNLDIKFLTNLKGRIDLEKMRLRRVGLWEILALFVMTIVFLFGFLFFLSIAFSSSALVRFDDNEPWLWLSGNSAHSNKLADLLSNESGWDITVSDCDNNIESIKEKVRSSGVSKETVDIICRSFANEKDKAKVEEIIREQKILVVPALVALFFVLLPYIELQRIGKSLSARRHVFNKYRSHRKVKFSI
tara:strand:- start:5509 stop:6360 length:852 start_codon:yes stop_codon:yes gene_type:complete